MPTCVKDEVVTSKLIFNTITTYTHNILISQISLQIKKAVPLQAWTGSEGSRRLKLPDFKTIGT